MENSIKTFGAVVIGACLALGQAHAEEETINQNQTTLTGDWGGKRSELAGKGINLNFTHRSDVFANLEGGIDRGSSWLGYTDVQIGLDLDRLWGWDGTTAYVVYHSDLGGKPNGKYVGSFMGVDNIEVSTNTAQFSQFWLEKDLWDDSLSVLVGLYAMDSEFYVTGASGLFLHPSMGMSAEIAQTGANGPPVFPTASLGARVKYLSADKTGYLQVALLDGVPGDPNNPHGTHVRLDQGDGTIAIAELGYAPASLENAPPGYDKTAIGLWRYSTHFDDLLDRDGSGNPLKRRSMGWYVLAERALSPEKDSPGQGLAGFARFGTASPDIHQSDWSASVGVIYTGLFDGRDEDVVGIALTTSHASSKYRSINLSDDHETMVEVTYKFQLQPWASLQPLLQRIFHPCMDPALKDAWVLGTRMEIQL